MKVLVLAAHPDDEVLGCGGTIRRLADEGAAVHIAIFGEGLTSRAPQRADTSAQPLLQLQAQAEQAAQILGARDVVFFGLPDNRFDTVPLLDVVKRVEGLLERVQPEMVFTQHGGDLNIDHQRLYRATLTATRPLPGQRVKTVYAYEVASSSEWAFQQFSPLFAPDTFFDIGATLDAKLRALAQYVTEIRPFPHPRSPEALRAIAQRWGSLAGMVAAEAFQTVRALR